MCFSASASFIAGTSLSGIGVATLRRVETKTEIPFAMIPLLFGLQQLIEGVLWLTFAGNAAVLRQPMIYAYSGFSHVLWPIYVPFAIYLLEPAGWRRRVIAAFQVVGLVVGLSLLYFIVTRPVVAELAGKHIVYVQPHFFMFLGQFVLYLAATSIACFFSSHRFVNLFGALLLSSFIAAYAIHAATMVSVWCFFAALLSVVVYIPLRYRGMGGFPRSSVPLVGSQMVVVVTGASSGVGRAVARAFGRRGARVALLARNEEALAVAAEEIRQAGGEALVLPTDVSDADGVERAAATVEGRWGRIDTWVNVAMVTVLAPVKDTSAAEYRRVTEVTYLGYVHGTLAALRRMLPRDEGTIVQVGSAVAYRSIPLQSAYCAAKAAVRAFTDSLRSELFHDGSHVRLTHVHLPAVNTPQSRRQRNKMPRLEQPVPPLFSPETVAEAILWAAEHAPREMLVGAPTLKAVWGQKFIPSFLDRYLAKAAWDPQFVNQPNDRQRDILFETMPGDPGAHGPYRDRERGPDLQLRLRMCGRTGLPPDLEVT